MDEMIFFKESLASFPLLKPNQPYGNGMNLVGLSVFGANSFALGLKKITFGNYQYLVISWVQYIIFVTNTEAAFKTYYDAIFGK